MSLVVNHNTMAWNAARNLDKHYTELSTSVRRLSSGLRVGTAADDAAGLSIREMMRLDIAALNQGVRNANDAISLIQTMDGALSIIDEKLIRMKELSEQAATGTYTSEQRLMIDSEFQAMAAEINRIAAATDFNSVHLLDGSRQGAHAGFGLDSTGAVKIHFGTGNDSAEDYYYISGFDATCYGLFDLAPGAFGEADYSWVGNADANLDPDLRITLNVLPPSNSSAPGGWLPQLPTPPAPLNDMTAILPEDDVWRLSTNTYYMFIIPKGTKNIVINTLGMRNEPAGITGDNDIQIFTRSGVHLSGTPLTDRVWIKGSPPWVEGTIIEDKANYLGFTREDYNGSYLNTGPKDAGGQDIYDGTTLGVSSYNGMTISYSGDAFMHDSTPNDLYLDYPLQDFEILKIDEATEDLIFYLPGVGSAFIKAQWDAPVGGTDPTPAQQVQRPFHIKTQTNAQNMLERVNKAIVNKDNMRADLGAMQNRLENTITNLQTQSENLQAAESRISDVDVAVEMTRFVRNQILSQAAVAMLAQANNMPQMAAGLMQGG